MQNYQTSSDVWTTRVNKIYTAKHFQKKTNTRKPNQELINHYETRIQRII